MLKLSEAIALGRTLVPVLKAGSVPNCAIGMALLAHDANHQFCPDRRATGRWAADYDKLLAMYPWLKESGHHCPKCGQATKDAAVIWHVFDTHVRGIRNMTFDAMVDWIRSIEPATDVAQEPITQPAQNEAEELVTVT